MSFSRFSLVLALSTLMAACAVPPTRPLPADRDAAWQVHRLELEALSHWRLNGSLAVRAHREGGQAYVDWRQQGPGYDIRLSGPLGSGGARLSGSDSGVTLTLASGERRSDTDAAQLLHDELGWWIPVESLRFWALGLPAPGAGAQWSLDAYGRLAALEQQGWTVRFDDYKDVEGLDLPGRLAITGEDAEVKLVVRRWSLPVAEAQ